MPADGVPAAFDPADTDAAAAARSTPSAAHGQDEARAAAPGSRYTAAILIAGLAAALHWLVYPWTGSRIPFLFFLAATALTAVTLGRGPAVLTLLLGALNAFLLMAPTGRWEVASLADRLAFIAFALVGGLLVGIGGRLRGATREAAEARRRLEAATGQLEQQVADLQHLHDLSGKLLELPDLDSELREILATLAHLHGATQGLVSLIEPGTDVLCIQASVGLSPQGVDALRRVRVGEGACGRAFAERRRVVVEDVDTDPCFEPLRALAHREGFRAVHSTPLVTLSGDMIGVIAVHLPRPRGADLREMRLADICARKAAVFIERAHARAQARAVEQRFESVLEASAVPFNVLAPVRDAVGHIVDFRWDYVNSAAAQVLQHPAQRLLGRRVTEIFPHNWREPGLFEHYVAVADQGQVREFEIDTTALGRAVSFHVIASPLHGDVAVWYADISDYRQQEKALKEADRRKDEFLAVLAHELRNPLAPIRQAALLSRAPQATDAQKRWSQEVIERQVQHMALLLDDLLDVSRITRGILSLRSAPTDLATVVDAAVETARPLIDSKRHHLSVELPDPPLRLLADGLRLAQVLGNLLTNAAKYTDPGGRIELRAWRADAGVSIAVSDNGVGLAPQDLERVFDMFTQVGSSQERSNGGLGIGLALARGLVALHGGRLEADSAGPGRGSRFTVRLPALEAGAPPGGGHDAVSTPPPHAPAAPGRRILIADDNQDAADSLAQVLRLQGHEVVVAFDGAQAVQAFQDQPADVVLLDIGMPTMSGTEAARRIRATPAGRHAVLIAITGWGQLGDRHRSSAAGFNHHLTKPVDLGLLASLLAVPQTSAA